MAGNGLVASGTSGQGRFNITSAGYSGIAGADSDFQFATELNIQVPFGAGATLSQMAVRFGWNANITINLRKNAGNGSQSVTGSATFLQDATHSDSFATGDTGDTYISGTVFGTGVYSTNFKSSIYSSLISNGFDAGGASNSHGSTQYFDLGGSVTQYGTDGASLFRFKACTLSYFSVFASANTLNGTETLNLRKNSSANLNGTVSYAGAATGLVTDSTHSDTLVDNDICYVKGTNAAAAGSITLAFVSAWQAFQTTQTLIGDGIAGWAPGQAGNGHNAYLIPCGSMNSGAGASDNLGKSSAAADYVAFPAVWQNLRMAQVSTSTSGGGPFNATVKSYVNAADANQIVTIGNGLSAVDIEDTTHTDSLPFGTNIALHMNSAAATGSITWLSHTSQLNGAVNLSTKFLWVST